MKSVSNEYKEQLTALGRQYNVLVNYSVNGTNYTLSNSELNIVTPHYQGDLLKSTMKQLDLDSNIDIPIGTEINCQFGLLVNNAYEYIDYGNYIVYSSEKQEDLKSYKIVCYDKMLYAMKDYEALETVNLFNDTLRAGVTDYQYGTYSSSDIRITSTDWIILPAGTYTISATTSENKTLNVSNVTFDTEGNFYNISGISGQWLTLPRTFTTPVDLKWKCNIKFSDNSAITTSQVDNVMIVQGDTATNYQPYLQTIFPMTVKEYLTTLSYNLNIPLATQSFVNDDVEISTEKYLDENGNDLGYTYRDVLDDLAQVTASTICINNDDELEVRYLNDTQGKNLLHFNNYSRTAYGLTGTIEDDTFTITGTNTKTDANWGFMYPSFSELSNKLVIGNKYTISTKERNSLNRIYFQINYYVSGSTTQRSLISTSFGNGGVATFTIPNDYGSVASIFIGVLRTATNVNTTFKVQLEEGDTPTEYEDYGNYTINETYLKDTNVNFKEKYGPINSVVFSRSADSDLIYRQDATSITNNGLCELKIKDNQLLNDNDRDNFIDEIFNKLSGLEYYLNDYTSTGITILELCDKYNVKVDDNIYSCIMLNDELNVTQGFDETIHTDKPDTSESDYKKADTTDRRINQAYLIVDKQNQEITALTSRTNNLATQVNNDKQELLNKFGDYATNSQVQSLTTQVSNIQTDTYTKTEVSQILKGTFYDSNNNQVVSEVVKTISGTFDVNGMTYAKTNAKTSTTINEVGVRVNNTTSSDELLFAGYDDSISQTIVRTDNLLVRNYLNIGSNSRLQDYETGTGVFDI